MAILTPLSDEHAQRLGREFGLDVAEARAIPAGSVNTNYELVLTGGGRAFLRVYEEQTAEGAAGEAALLDRLADRGVPSPRPLSRSGAGDGATGFLASFEGKPVAVFPWVDGEVLCQERVRPAHATRVGGALARVHLAGEGYAAGESRFGPRELRARVDAIPMSARTGDLGRALDRLRGALAEASPSPARMLVHGDLFRDNVLWRRNETEIAALLDFESAAHGAPTFDLMVAVLAWCYGDVLDRDLARALVSGYVAVRPLASEDVAALYGDATFAATRFAVTRITDFELRPRSSGVYKDYRRFLGRLDALEALGPRGLTAFLGL